jgi:hypothetical protein
MNRMRCKSAGGESWTTVRVRALRERLGIAGFDPTIPRPKTISVDETAHRLKICVGSVLRLIKSGILPAQQLMPSAPWQVPLDALGSLSGLRAITSCTPNFTRFDLSVTPAAIQIRVDAGSAIMRRGFHGLSARVQTVLEQQPLSGHVFVFRGRRGDRPS